MSAAALDLKVYLVGVLVGQGEVRGLSGRLLRRFTLEFFGEWSIGGDALHFDETILYDDGREVRRHWAIQFDGDGRLLGYDSQQAARMRGRPLADRWRVVFDRPLALGQAFVTPRFEIQAFETTDGGLRLEGRISLLGLVVRRTQAILSRRPR